MSGGIIATYLVVLVAIWLLTLNAVSGEPTAHGQSILAPMGCLLGVFWPLFVAYLVIASPWIAWTWWQTRSERS